MSDIHAPLTPEEERLAFLAGRGTFGALRAWFGAVGECFNYERTARLLASFQSADYYAEHLQLATSCKNQEEILAATLPMRPPEGLVLEFGVGPARTTNQIAASVSGPVHGFDSFEGLPEDWRPSYKAGNFAQAVPQVRPNVVLHVGLFADTLPPFVAQEAGPVSFLHIDCDLYSSTVTVLSALKGRIGAGTVIVFNEYLNYPGWRNGEYKAFQEFLADTGLRYRYTHFVPTHQQVAVVIE